MANLPGFWHGAAQVSGRVDFGRLAASWPDREMIESLGALALVRAGVPLDLACRITGAPELADSGPWMCVVDRGYPPLLAASPRPPGVLFWRGDPALLCEPCVAIVGTRRCTASGLRMARLLSRAVAAAGAVVVSGLAHGIDSAAHEAALPRTVAVLGQGLNTGLSSAQARLVNSIVDSGGLVISEFPPSWPPSRFSFPQRNRIIAGLCQATVVVEAGIRSGARITARCALEAGREVLAVPGHPLAEGSAGCNDLLQNGATMVCSPADLVNSLGLAAHSPQARLLEALGGGGTVDSLMARTGRDALDLTCALSALELAGLVERLPGDRYAPRR